MMLASLFITYLYFFSFLLDFCQWGGGGGGGGGE